MSSRNLPDGGSAICRMQSVISVDLTKKKICWAPAVFFQKIQPDFVFEKKLFNRPSDVSLKRMRDGAHCSLLQE